MKRKIEKYCKLLRNVINYITIIALIVIITGCSKNPDMQYLQVSSSSYTKMLLPSPSMTKTGIIPSITFTPSLTSTLLQTPTNTLIQPNWKNFGPEGGKISTIEVDPKNPTILYAAGEWRRGLFKSEDGGSNWFLINIEFDVNTLAIDPITPTTLYVGTYSSGIFKSTDGGENWKAINAGRPGDRSSNPTVNSILIDPSKPDTLYVAGFGIFKSQNGGENWTELHSDLLNDELVLSLAIDPIKTNQLYAGISGDYPGGNSIGGVVKSIDGGNNWFEHNTGFPSGKNSIYSLAIDPLFPETIYAGTREDIYKSTDEGNNWIEIIGNFHAHCIEIDPINSTNLYVANYEGIYKSANGGKSWNKLNILNHKGLHVVTIDPKTPTNIYAGTYYDGIYKSANGGLTWLSSNTGLTFNSIYTLAYSEKTPSTIYAGTSSGVYKNTIGQEKWYDIRNGLLADVNALVINPKNTNIIYAGTYNGVYKSTNGGGNWIFNNTGIPSERYSTSSIIINPTNPNILYVGSTYGDVFKSIDSGNNWFKISHGLPSMLWVYALAINPETPTIIYAATDNGVWRSMDEGENWNSINNGLESNIVYSLVIDPFTPTTIYIGTTKGVYRSSNNGDEWIALNEGLPVDAKISTISINCLEPSILYIGVREYGIYKSITGGEDWKYMGLKERNIYTIIIIPSSPIVIYGGTEIGVYKLET